MKFSDWKILRVIGTGTFGKVYLATLDGEAFALKALKKSKVIELK
jgi:serine/threonine protein kinase